jgi:hypothetical protein
VPEAAHAVAWNASAAHIGTRTMHRNRRAIAVNRTE